MFFLLGGVLCLAVLFLLVAMGTAVNMVSYRFISWMAQRIDRSRLPNVILIIHLAPFLLGFGMVLGFVLPAFMKLEPHSTREALGLGLIAAALLGAATLSGIFMRYIQMLRATSRQEAEWLKHARPLWVEGVSFPVYVLPMQAAIMAVTGILRSRIFISEKIASALTQEELAAAIAHEIAHIQSRDNLKQLLLRITQPPPRLHLGHIFEAWINAAELAADRAAISNGTPVADLASALVKVARLSTFSPLPGITASHLVPDATDSSMAARVLQLKELLNSPPWMGRDFPPSTQANSAKWILTLSAVVFYIASLNSALPLVHDILEWLVR